MGVVASEARGAYWGTTNSAGVRVMCASLYRTMVRVRGRAQDGENKKLVDGDDVNGSISFIDQVIHSLLVKEKLSAVEYIIAATPFGKRH